MNIDTGQMYQGEQAIKEAQERGERLVTYYGPRKPLREVRAELEALRKQALADERIPELGEFIKAINRDEGWDG